MGRQESSQLEAGRREEASKTQTVVALQRNNGSPINRFYVDRSIDVRDLDVDKFATDIQLKNLALNLNGTQQNPDLFAIKQLWV